MKKVRFFLEYILLKLFGGALRFIPRKAVLFLGRRAGDIIFFCIPIRKKMTQEHLRLAFPEKSDREIRGIARQAYQNLGMNSFEHLCLPHLPKEELIDSVKLENEQILRDAFAGGKGAIFVGGHFGNWEYMGGAVGSRGYPVTFVVAQIANPYIDAMVNEHRKNAGVEVLNKGMSARGILKALHNNSLLAMLIDQDAGRNGIFVEYFGRPCSTPRGPALFALKTGAPLVFVSSIRQADGTLRAVLEKIEVDYEAGVTEENVTAIMQYCTSRLEEYVRRYPGHWFWMHRRWKTSLDGVKQEG